MYFHRGGYIYVQAFALFSVESPPIQELRGHDLLLLRSEHRRAEPVPPAQPGLSIVGDAVSRRSQAPYLKTFLQQQQRQPGL